jgi:RND superfamily putative drug exporter
MFARSAKLVERHSLLVVAGWLALALLVRAVAPSWDQVTEDGDMAHLPPTAPSSVGQKLIEAAFPDNRAKSQIALIVSREAEPLRPSDLRVADALACRFHLLHGVSETRRAMELLDRVREQDTARDAASAEQWQRQADRALTAALASLDEALRMREDWPEALHDRSIVHRLLDQLSLADQDQEKAWQLAPRLSAARGELVPAEPAPLPLVGVWTRHTEVVGTKLRSENRQAQLVVLQLSNEFMATDNIRVLSRVEEEVNLLKRDIPAPEISGLSIHISGSAAVGGDMLRYAAKSVENTEVLTVVLVVVILLVVYRAPLLTIIPLLTILASLEISTGLLALLTQLDTLPGFEWWHFKIFKTTKIFIVVILFGSGTDFCLFLIARYRELLASGQPHSAARIEALSSVGGAVTGSAMTTILGLGMMAFADYGKFRNSGPAISLCLAVTLCACLTLAPALLRIVGLSVFWPFSHRPSAAADAGSSRQASVWWHRIANMIVRHPGLVLVTSLVLMTPLAVLGLFSDRRVTFDLLNELPATATSRQGSNVLRQHFPVGEGGPLVVLAHKTGAGFDNPDRQIAAQASAAIFGINQSLLQVPGVVAVRSLAEPLGDPPKRISLVSREGRRKLFLREHSLTKSLFLATGPGYHGNVTRFEILLNHDPFSVAALETLDRVDRFFQGESAKSDSFWHGASFSYAGTTAGIRDLRVVTASDQRRIQVLVVTAVFAVLLFLLWRPAVCLYLVLSVLFSYFVSIGCSELVFRWLYGATFQGLDWKVPVFLFVILVAVGEDYNIYLVARVFEEQKIRGPLAGLREALIRTGGIITSCGVIMAGTFVSMMSGSLRAIVELGFALSFGILLDTFVVRTLIVPAFLVVWSTWSRAGKPANGSQNDSDQAMSTQ